LVPINRHIRRWMLAAAAVCLAGFLFVGIRLHNVHGPVGLDLRTARPVFGRLSGVPVVSYRAARDYYRLGDHIPFALITAALAAAAAWLSDWLSALVAVVGPASTVLLTELVCKPLFGRSINGADSFPSGHTAALTALAACMVLLAARRWGRKGAAGAVPLGLLVSGSMVLSVVRVQAHYVSDALAGVLLGVIVVLAAAVAVSVVVEVLVPQWDA